MNRNLIFLPHKEWVRPPRGDLSHSWLEAPDDILFRKEDALSSYTEGWKPKFQKWEKQGRVEVKDEHKIYTMLLESPKAIPHIRAFKFVPID